MPPTLWAVPSPHQTLVAEAEDVLMARRHLTRDEAGALIGLTAHTFGVDVEDLAALISRSGSEVPQVRLGRR